MCAVVLVSLCLSLCLQYWVLPRFCWDTTGGREGGREAGRQAGRGDTQTDRQWEGGWDESLGFDDEERKGERESLY